MIIYSDTLNYSYRISNITYLDVVYELSKIYLRKVKPKLENATNDFLFLSKKQKINENFNRIRFTYTHELDLNLNDLHSINALWNYNMSVTRFLFEDFNEIKGYLLFE